MNLAPVRRGNGEGINDFRVIYKYPERVVYISDRYIQRGCILSMVILTNSPWRYTYILSIIHLEARGGYVKFFFGSRGGGLRSRKIPSFNF